MNARFLVRESFPFRARNVQVLAGDILEGAIRPGMVAHLSLNRSLDFVMRIKGVEFLDKPGGVSLVALTIEVGDPGAYDIYELFPSVGDQLEFTSGTEADAASRVV